MSNILSKVNIPVRMKNPWFWIGIASAILSALNLELSTFTSWAAVWQCVVDVFSNPFKLVTVALTVLAIFIDPTTAGVGDSSRALTYTSPAKD